MTVKRLPADSAGASDEALLAAIASGDSRALAQLYDRFAGVVYAFALRMLGSVELAEDIVQETFWRVWRRSGTFERQRGPAAGWIFGIARNLSIDELRRQRSRPVPVYETPDRPVLGDLMDERADVAGAALANERHQVIRTALTRLPREQRQVIELADFGGLSQSEIASRLQSPVGTIKTRARLGLRKLRDLLTDQEYQPDA